LSVKLFFIVIYNLCIEYDYIHSLALSSVPEPFPDISFRVTGKGALPPGSLHRAPKEREKDTLPPEPLSTISQSPL